MSTLPPGIRHLQAVETFGLLCRAGWDPENARVLCCTHTVQAAHAVLRTKVPLEVILAEDPEDLPDELTAAAVQKWLDQAADFAETVILSDPSSCREAS